MVCLAGRDLDDEGGRRPGELTPFRRGRLGTADATPDPDGTPSGLLRFLESKKATIALFCRVFLTRTGSSSLETTPAACGPRVQIYLPIAELPVNMFLIFGMGGAVGFLSGLFGVGGGFLLTPLLIFSGIPPAVAVASTTAQVVASSTSAALSYWRRQLIDVKLAAVLVVAGIIGSSIGVGLFSLLRRLGQLDLVIAICYVTFLGLVGGLMLTESVRAILNARRGKPAPLRRPGQHNWVHGLPFKMRFKRSKLYVSVIPILGIGIGIGMLGSLLGIGGGFILVPALIYLLRVPTNIVIGTSLIQMIGTMAVATVLQSGLNHNVDGVLALILMVGGVIGAQFGARVGVHVRGEQLRAMLALLVLAVGVRFLVNLVHEPGELFSLATLSGDTR